MMLNTPKDDSFHRFPSRISSGLGNCRACYEIMGRGRRDLRTHTQPKPARLIPNTNPPSAHHSCRGNANSTIDFVAGDLGASKVALLEDWNAIVFWCQRFEYAFAVLSSVWSR